jgi:hypothetical protein
LEALSKTFEAPSKTFEALSKTIEALSKLRKVRCKPISNGRKAAPAPQRQGRNPLASAVRSAATNELKEASAYQQGRNPLAPAVRSAATNELKEASAYQQGRNPLAGAHWFAVPLNPLDD